MARKLKILIVDPNRFFVAGLQQAVRKHFQAKGVPVVFMDRPLSYPKADLIFWAPGYSTTIMPIELLADRKHKSHLILLVSQQITHLITGYVPWVFYLHQSRSHLLTLIEQVVNTSTDDNIETVQSHCPLSALSPREKEVISCISKGLHLRAISECLHIHPKTVSSHKRSAMRKLQLHRTSDVYYWLLCNPIIDNPL